MIAGVVLGRTSLLESYPLALAVVVGLCVHVSLSVAYTLLFASLASPLFSRARLLVGGMTFGLALWVVNFYVLSPIGAWWWFADRTNPVVQLVAHVFFFGCPVAWMLSRSHVELRS
jgi:hypothetical protein